MMTLLEERYRWWLRLLPAWYRLGREEEMVATFMEAAGTGDDAEVAGPGWAEIRGVLSLAVRTRLGGAGAVPRAQARGEGVRMFALGATLMQAIFATILLWDFLQRPASAPSGLALQLGAAVWIAVYLTVVLGRWQLAGWLALAAAGYSLYALGARPAPVADTPDAIAVTVGLGVLPAVAIIAAFHHDAAPVPRTGPLAALPAGAIAIGLWSHLPGPDAPTWLIPDLPALYCWPFLAASAGYAITRRFTGRLQGPGWALGLVLLAVPILTARILGLSAYLGQQPGFPPGWLNTATAAAAVQAVLVGLATLALLVTAARALRRLPASPAASRGPGPALPG
jgi:hypothetical protein